MGKGSGGGGADQSNTHNTVESVSKWTEQKLPGPITLCLRKIQGASEDTGIKMRAWLWMDLDGSGGLDVQNQQGSSPSTSSRSARPQVKLLFLKNT